MKEKNTDELMKILKNTHSKNVDQYFAENKESMLDADRPFTKYFKECLKKKKIRQQDVFLYADIPERYGYKLISMEKKTLQRDTILRLCYAAEFTLEETQKALKLYDMPVLYPRKERDAILIICFNKRPGSVIEVNMFLKKHGYDPLRPSGVQE